MGKNFFDWLREGENKEKNINIEEGSFTDNKGDIDNTSEFEALNKDYIGEGEIKSEVFIKEDEIRQDKESKKEAFAMGSRPQEREEGSSVEEKLKAYVDKKIEKNRPRHGFLKGLALVLAGSLIGSFIGLNIPRKELSKPGQEQVASLDNSDKAIKISTTEESNVESAVAKKSTPSVVGIKVNVRSAMGPFESQIFEGQAIGSGVVLSKNGFILTNSHVVADANPEEGVEILFSNNTKAVGKVMWQDPTVDLAIVKTDKTDLTPIELADSDKVEIGQKAIAIGNPVGLNLQSTLTSGYISGMNRSIQLQDGAVLDGLFQTDAAINSGNSGGALLDKEGKLIGINTAKVQSTDGIGFAIPINVAKPVIKSFLENGRFESVELGIRGVSLDLYKQYAQADEKLRDQKGIYVVDVPRGGNAFNAGLRENDIIIEVNSVKVESMNKLKQILLTFNKGDSTKIKVLRDNVKKEIEIVFAGKAPNI